MNKLYIYADSFGAYTKNWKQINPGKINCGIDYHKRHHFFTQQERDFMYESCWPDLLAESLNLEIGNIGVLGASPFFTAHTWVRDWRAGDITDDDSDVYVFIWSQHTRMPTPWWRGPWNEDDPRDPRNSEKSKGDGKPHDVHTLTLYAAVDIERQKDLHFWKNIFHKDIFLDLTTMLPSQPLATMKSAIQLHIWAAPEEPRKCWVNDLAPTLSDINNSKYSIIGWSSHEDPERVPLREAWGKREGWDNYTDGLSNHMSPEGNHKFAVLLKSIIETKQQTRLTIENEPFRYW